MTQRRTKPHDVGIATVIGAGIAGTEAALQLAHHGIEVSLHEMRPGTMSPIHRTAEVAELVCSNSLKSDDPTTAAGQLKRELETLGSFVLRTARETRLPAGAALAVDRAAFSACLTSLVTDEPRIDLVRKEVTMVPEERPLILAVGPLPSRKMEKALAALVGDARLAFYDAAAPIVDAESIDTDIAFAASRYDKGEGADYLNCPLDQAEYERFVDALVSADRVLAHDFEKRDLFDACQPAEEIARKGRDALRYGAMKPVGLIDPRTGARPWAVVQLRAENRERTAYNLVGFQTNLTFAEQRRVLSMIPGLADADLLRYGVMHRNTFIDAPRLLDETLALRDDPSIRLAGQVTGTEGYLEAAGSGLLSALNLAASALDMPPVVLPRTTALGALIAHATDPNTSRYQPMHVNWGLVPPLDPPVRGKRARYAAYAERALTDIRTYVANHPLLSDAGLQ